MNEQYIGSKKTYSTKIKKPLNTKMQGTANQNAAGICRICKRSDQAKLGFMAFGENVSCGIPSGLSQASNMAAPCPLG